MATAAIFGYNFGVNQILCITFGTVMENHKSTANTGDIWVKKSSFRISKIADSHHHKCKKKYYSVVDCDVVMKFCMMAEMNSIKSTVCSKLRLEISSRWRRLS